MSGSWKTPTPRRRGEGSIAGFDKTTIYQQIASVESAEELGALESRVELIDAIQRTPILRTLPESALYFLEREISFRRYGPKVEVLRLAPREHISQYQVVLAGQLMVLSESGAVVSYLKAG